MILTLLTLKTLKFLAYAGLLFGHSPPGRTLACHHPLLCACYAPLAVLVAIEAML